MKARVVGISFLIFVASLCTVAFYLGDKVAHKPIEIVKVTPETKKSAYLKYEVGILEKLIKSKTPAFIHFTGPACLLCKYEWAKVDESKLFDGALANGFVLYEYDIGDDWGKILNEVSKYGIFGVPAYMFIDKDGKVHVQESIEGHDEIIAKMKEYVRS